MSFDDNFFQNSNTWASLTSDLPLFMDALPDAAQLDGKESPKPLSGRVSDGVADEGGSMSFKELHAERNKQAQRRFRKRQKEKMQELSDQVSDLKAQQSALHGEQARLEDACQMLDNELKKIREKQKLANEQEEDDLARSFQGAVTLTFKEQETITLTPNQIKQMSEQELARFWSTYVKELAVLLVSVEGTDSPPSEVMARMKDLVQNELLFLYIRAALTNMQSVKKFVAHAKIEEVRVAAGAMDGHNRWNEVSQALKLTPEQAQQITALWRNFVVKVSDLVESRHLMHQRLLSTSHSGDSAYEAATKTSEAQEQMEALKKSLRAEHVQIHEFLVAFFLQGLNVIQMARCFVRSFPFYPDIPAIAAWVAIANKDPLAQTKLTALECISPAVST